MILNIITNGTRHKVIGSKIVDGKKKPIYGPVIPTTAKIGTMIPLNKEDLKRYVKEFPLCWIEV